MKNEYVVIKLTNGEFVLANVLSRSYDQIRIHDAISMKHIPSTSKDGTISERIMTAKFCHYTDEEEFVLQMSQVLFVKALSARLVPHYEAIVKDFKKESDNMYLDEEDDIAKQENLWNNLESKLH